MALLPNIDDAPGADTMAQVFDKIKAAITTINASLGGGTAGQQQRKASDNDFDFEFFTPNQATVVQVSESYTPSTNTSFLTGIITTPSGDGRSNVITISFTLFSGGEIACTTTLLKDGSTLRTLNHTIINTATDTASYSTVVSYTFADLNADPGSTYQVGITVSASSVLSNYSLVVQSSL